MLCANELEILRDLNSKTGRETSRIRQVPPLQAEFGMGEGRIIIAAPSDDRTCIPPELRTALDDRLERAIEESVIPASLSFGRRGSKTIGFWVTSSRQQRLPAPRGERNMNGSPKFPPSWERDINRLAAPTQSRDDPGVSYKCPRVPV
jgi:hypothetical protein